MIYEMLLLLLLLFLGFILSGFMHEFIYICLYSLQQRRLETMSIIIVSMVDDEKYEDDERKKKTYLRMLVGKVIDVIG